MPVRTNNPYYRRKHGRPARRTRYNSTTARTARLNPYRKNPVYRKAVKKAARVTRKVNQKNKQLFRPSFIPASCVIKNLTLTGYDDQALFGNDGVMQGASDPIEWHMIKPLNINRVAMTNPDMKARQSDAIWARNTKFKMEVFPSKRNIHGCQIRVVYGYYKGDSNQAIQALSVDNLKSIYPKINDKLQDREHTGKQDFYWKSSKTFTFTPHQVFDEDLEEGDHTGDDRVLVALHRPKTFYVNFNYNRKVTYENDDGDSLNGYLPIICIQCKPIPGGSQLTRPTLPASADHGNNPCPRVSVDCSTYFSDIH